MIDLEDIYRKHFDLQMDLQCHTDERDPDEVAQLEKEIDVLEQMMDCKWRQRKSLLLKSPGRRSKKARQNIRL